MYNNSSKIIIQEKKTRFIIEVENSAVLLNLDIPKIKFLKYHEPSRFKNGERAHINLQTKTIFISEQELEKMDYEEIRNTASHEVIHLIYPDHSDRFWNTLRDVQVELWNPPACIISIGRNKKNIVLKNRINKNLCNFSPCDQKNPQYECPYCKALFCKIHLIPQEPTFDKRFIIENLHPCFPYLHFLEKEKKKIENIFAGTLEEEFAGSEVKIRRKYGHKKLSLERVKRLVELNKKNKKINNSSKSKQISLCNKSLRDLSLDYLGGSGDQFMENNSKIIKPGELRPQNGVNINKSSQSRGIFNKIKKWFTK